MNKRHLLTGFMFLLCTYTAFAQQVEVKKDSIGRAVHLPPEQKQLLNMDKDGFVLPDMNVAPNERTATIQTDSMTLHISPPEFIDVPWPAPRLGTSFNPFSRDYNRSDIFGINANSYLSTYSLYNTYPTMGTHIQPFIRILPMTDGSFRVGCSVPNIQCLLSSMVPETILVLPVRLLIASMTFCASGLSANIL